MAEARTKQLTYVVRLWREGGNAPWRASAQSALTGERIYFASAVEVCEFLRAAMDLPPTISRSGGETDRSVADTPGA